MFDEYPMDHRFMGFPYHLRFTVRDTIRVKVVSYFSYYVR